MAKAEQQTVDVVDKLFNAWLALNNIFSHDGHLYQADNKGQIVYDAQGRPIIVDVHQFKLLIADPQKGFHAYAAVKGIRINTVQRTFPKK